MAATDACNCELLGRPAELLMEGFAQAGVILQPYREVAHGYLEQAFGFVAPDFLPWLDKYVAANAHAHAAAFPLMDFRDVLLITLGYLLTVFMLTLFTKTFLNKGFRLRLFAPLHNLVLTTLSLYMAVELIRQAFFVEQYTVPFGNGVADAPAGAGLSRIIWVFYISKIFEFTDTIIMALKKNYRQISFLHLYHHASIFMIWWMVSLMAPGGDSYFSAFLNSFVHVVMYGYYFVTSFGVKLHFIKKYITSMQMTQFCLMLIQATYDWAVPMNGYFPVILTQILFFYMISLLALFANFFSKDRKRIAQLAAAQKKAKTE